MSVTFSRRELLRYTVVSALAPFALPIAGCSEDAENAQHIDPLTVFPQGIASADPLPSAVLLWTRVQTDAASPVKVGYDVAKDESFSQMVTSGEVEAKPDDDFTVHLDVTDLDAYTTYYYRFRAEGATSEVGRTKTAPAAAADQPLRFAFACCQDFAGRYYHAWQALVEEAPDLDFVVFLGDYIYETAGDLRFQTPTADRSITIPDGQDIGSGVMAAVTLDDYRGLYKQYRSDARLREAHRLYPFISIWDDHEFADDCWQDHSTYFNDKQGDEKHTAQREAASRAWHEHQAARAVYDAQAAFPEQMRIYRSLRYGKHMELFLIDDRSYRSDHVIPEGPADSDVGKLNLNTSVGSRQFLLATGFNPKEALAKPKMLGAAQKQWLVDGVSGSTATWKVLGSQTQMSQMLVDLSGFSTLPAQYQDRFYISVDQWDGFRTERAEILTALGAVEGLAVIAGDIHAFYSSELHVDFDAPGPTPAAVEFVVAGISSAPIAPTAKKLIEGDPVLSGLGLLPLIDQWDELLAQGSPHYRYANSHSNGIAVVAVGASKLDVTFLIVNDVTQPGETGIAERVHLSSALGTNKVVMA